MVLCVVAGLRGAGPEEGARLWICCCTVATARTVGGGGDAREGPPPPAQSSTQSSRLPQPSPEGAGGRVEPSSYVGFCSLGPGSLCSL